MVWLDKKLFLEIVGLTTLSGLLLYSEINENSKKTKNLEVVNKNTIIDYLIEDTIKTYKDENIPEKRFPKFTHY